MKHFFITLLKRLPSDAPVRPLMEAVVEAEQASEREQEERQEQQFEQHRQLRAAAAERRKRILNRP